MPSGGFPIIANTACTLKAPLLQLFLDICIGRTRIWYNVREGDLGVCGDVACRAYDLHIRDEAAADVAIAAVIDKGGVNEKAAAMESIVLL